MAATKSFGEHFKACRIKTGKTLRAFCLENGFDPGNISKLERGRMPPPTSEAKLTEYAHALQIEAGSDDWYEFFDRAALERGRIPKDVLSDEELLGKLSVLFRTVRGQKLDRSQLDALIERIRRA